MTERRFFGVDFSGATDAGRRIWIAELVVEADSLHVASCRPARELPGGDKHRPAAYAALVAHIAQAGDAVFGLDFPFGLPAALLGTDDWAAFARGFGARFAEPLDFKIDCARRADGRELRRACDRAAKVPWCAYNLRLYRQTFFGIRDVLAPLVRADAARVCPMQDPAPGRPVLLEICPASTLKRLAVYRSHSGYKTGSAAGIRADLLARVSAQFRIAIEPAIRARIVADKGGDALNSLVAAATAADVTRRGVSFQAADRMQALEGMVYV